MFNLKLKTTQEFKIIADVSMNKCGDQVIRVFKVSANGNRELILDEAHPEGQWLSTNGIRQIYRYLTEVI